MTPPNVPAVKSFHFDPMTDQPLDEEFERLIDMVGARRYLIGMVQELGVQINFDPDKESEGDCRKAVRAVIRNCKDYAGKEMKQ